MGVCHNLYCYWVGGWVFVIIFTDIEWVDGCLGVIISTVIGCFGGCQTLLLLGVCHSLASTITVQGSGTWDCVTVSLVSDTQAVQYLTHPVVYIWWHFHW